MGLKTVFKKKKSLNVLFTLPVLQRRFSTAICPSMASSLVFRSVNLKKKTGLI